MASLIPVIANDARNTGFKHLAGDKNASRDMANKWGNYARNPGKSMWKSFTSIFGFGAPHTMRRPVRRMPMSIRHPPKHKKRRKK